MSKCNQRIKIGLNLLDSANNWIAISEIAYYSGVTARQISPALAMIPDLDV